MRGVGFGILCLSTACILALACDDDDDDGPTGSRNPIPGFPGAGNFVDTINNPWLNFEIGRTFTYEAQTDEGTETIIVEVMDSTKEIIGVTTTVVHDQEFLNGELVEDTYDWFAQDRNGNVWYFGEDTRELEDGEVISTEGSWEAGVDGAQPGILMLADPRVGLTYHQERAVGVAEDMARILSLTDSATVPAGTFNNVLKTLEWSPLEPGVGEFKYYASGVGLVLEADTADTSDRTELLGSED